MPSKTENLPASKTSDLRERLEADIARNGGEATRRPELAGALGVTMFDVPGSEDGTVVVLLPRESLPQAPSQALVRIKSRAEGEQTARQYLGLVTGGPFAEPDSIRSDSHMLVTAAARGADYLPPYHGRVHVTLLGEELPDGNLIPHRLRPLPNSPVFVLDDDEAGKVLQTQGDIRLGLATGYRNLVVSAPSASKLVFPRHTAILGTTGSGKSTTVAGLVKQAQATGMAVVLLDVEGEYTHLHEATDDERMQAALHDRQLPTGGLPQEHMTVYHLVGREPANPKHPNRQTFSLQFARLSPYVVMDILDLSEPQRERFLKAYDVAKEVMRDLGIFPARGNADQERMAMEIDEFERGYPRLTLSFFLDIVGACLAHVEKPPKDSKKKDDDTPKREFTPFNKELATGQGQDALNKRLHSINLQGSPVSWRALLSRLWRLNRLKVFDRAEGEAKPLVYKNLLKPGSVAIIDLSDSGISELNNIVIADLLRGIQDTQDAAYQEYERKKSAGQEATLPTRSLLIIEEAHEFLSTERQEKMRILFEQVARIAKRGRKRGLGLVFVTQLPAHLPRQLFGLVNSYILHKITDPEVVNLLRRTVSGIDKNIWDRLPALAPGQALVSMPHMTRPLLVSIDPVGTKLRLVD